MTVKAIKQEARKKLALNMHQAIAVYAVEFTIFITLIALIVMCCVSLSVNMPAAIVMMCYGIVLAIVAIVGIGMVNFAMVDFYILTYKCKPYTVRRLGETLVRSNVTKIFLLSLKRTLIGLLLLICLIVPGVIYLMRTSMANYLLIANPKMTAKTALSASNKVMSGKTGSYFMLCLSMLGWYVLGILTLGLGFILILPYTNLIKAVYYKRNLQGDKAVYNYTPQQQSESVIMGAAQPNTANRQQTEQKIAPIDTLEAEDFMSMNDAMRGFGSQEAELADVKEVPIMPVTQKSTNNRRPAPESDEPAIPKVIDLIGNDIIPEFESEPEPITKSRSIDGTNIVETERILSQAELDAQAQTQKQAIERMYSRTDPERPAVDYFSGGGKQKQSPNDFVTAEVDVPDDSGLADFVQKPTESVIPKTSTNEHIISDSELDAFLHDFDAATEHESASAKPSASAPKTRSRTTERTPRTAERAVPRRAADLNREVMERAERLRKEREQRQKK